MKIESIKKVMLNELNLPIIEFLTLKVVYAIFNIKFAKTYQSTVINIKTINHENN